MEEQSQEQAAAPVVDIAISSELKYKKADFSHPKYKLSQLYPLSGLQTQTITSQGGQEIIFQLPAKVMNLSKCVLRYSFAQSNVAAGGNGISFFNHNTPLASIRQIQLYTQGGIYLVDLYYVNKFMDVAFFAEKPAKEFATEPYTNTNATSYNLGSFQSKQTGETALANAGFSQRLTTDINGVILAPSTVSYATPYTERSYVTTGDNAGGAPGNPFVTYISFDMKNLVDTIFSVDKDLYFGEVLNLRIIFDSIDAVTFESSLVLTNITNTTRNLTYSNITFFAAIEQDLSIANSIIQRVNTSGLSIPIPYVYSYKQNLAASTSQTISLRFNRAHGKKLRRVYHAPYHNTEANVYAYMRDNIGGTLTVTSFYTMLNNDREQDININCSLQEDYMMLKHKLRETTIGSVEEYTNKWFWVSDYTSEMPLCSKESQDVSLSSGINLGAEQKYDIYMTTTNRAFNHFSFAITEKELNIRPGQIIVM